MLDIDPGKLLIIGIVALVVIPPKDLPGVLRQVGQAVGKLRRMASEFQSQLMDAVREAELDEIRKNVATIADSAKLKVDFDPVATVRDEIKGALGEGAIGAAAPLPAITAKAAAEPTADGVFGPAGEPQIAADEPAAAAGFAPLVPEPAEATAIAGPSVASPSTASPSVAPAPASAESFVAAQDADARRS
jgi:sec-independent protein translocase protein TatB